MHVPRPHRREERRAILQEGRIATLHAAPDSVDAVREQILSVKDALPKRLRQCADYILANPEKIAVSTVAEIAAAAEVQPSAVVRFCQLLGFAGFSDMQRLYREAHSNGWPDYATRLAKLRERHADHGRLLLDFVGAGHKSLNMLAESIDFTAFGRAVDALRDAALIHVVGYRRAFPAAVYLAYVFEKMAIGAVLHDRVAGLAHTASLREGDVMTAVTFMPYAPETIELVREAEARGVPVIAITDSRDSPIVGSAAEVLVVRDIDVGAFRAMAATLTLATTLAVAVGAAREE